MAKVQIIYMGRKAMVDADQASKLQLKDRLVQEAMNLQHLINTQPSKKNSVLPELERVMQRILNINETIKNKVLFVA